MKKKTPKNSWAQGRKVNYVTIAVEPDLKKLIVKLAKERKCKIKDFVSYAIENLLIQEMRAINEHASKL